MSHAGISISWITALNTFDILRNSITLPSQKLKQYKKKEEMLQMFQVSLDSHTWTVLKTMSQLTVFLEYLEKKYTLSEQRKKKSPNAPVPKILKILSSHSFNYDDDKFISFFEFYDLEFNKIKSLKLIKNSGGRYVNKLCCSCSFLQWKNRQFVITPNGILYHKQKHGQKKICEYISFNKYFSFQFGLQTGDELGILIISYHRRLKLRANNLVQFACSIYYIQKAFQEHSKVRQHNFYGSFAPLREKNYVQFLVDGEEYFGAVAKEIQKAEHEVMIAGWWISPQFYLIRPIDPKNPQKNRLNTILKQIIAKNNVKIYILAYRQSPFFLPNDSSYTKQALELISPNIKVITHPINIIPSLWSHHQKIVLIDQKVAFLGGLDLCYGRYDNCHHSIKDKQNLYPGIQFNNSRIKDFQKVRQYEISNIMRSQHPRLPWHDVGVKLVGGVVNDIANHFIEYWNFACYEALYQERIVLVPNQKKISTRLMDILGTLKGKIMSLRQSEAVEQQNSEKRKNKQFEQIEGKNLSIKELIGQEMQQQQVKIFKTNSFLPEGNYQNGEEIVYRYAQDQKKSKQKQSATNETLQLRNHQYQASNNKRMNINKNIKKIIVSKQNYEEEDYDSDNGQYLNQREFDFQKNHGDVIYSEKGGIFRRIFKKIESLDEKKIINGKRKKYTNISDKLSQPNQIHNSPMDDYCQVLRSVSKWSIGCKENQSESSIHQAYLDMIKNAENFIYIENQFFMAATEGQKVLKNQVAKALIERISRAIHERKKFRVMFFMPLIPGFAGELDAPEAILPRVILHWQYLTIYQGQNSVIKSISRLTPNPSKYIQFYGLRTHALLNNQPKTQIIYLHTKLMIVDDKKLIIGSANINDRSMRGTRDSQIAVQVKGGKTVLSIVNGKLQEVSEKIKTLRIKLMKEHFGIYDANDNLLDFTDFLDSRLFERLQSIAEQNTKIYRTLFGCYPDNEIETLKQMKQFKRTPTRTQYLENFSKIKGHVVHFPYKFLAKQQLLDGHGIYPNVLTT